jgi:hypothetical protein
MLDMHPRDPRTNPRRGDEAEDGGYIRRVIERTGNMLRISSGSALYWMPVEGWQEWCEQTGVKPRRGPDTQPRLDRSLMGSAAAQCIEHYYDPLESESDG